MDGTLTKTMSPWQYIHQRLEIWDNRADVYWQNWVNKKIQYEHFCQLEVDLWNEKGVSLQSIQAYLDEIDLNGHNPVIFDHLIKNNIPIIIISTGFKYTLTRIQQQVQQQTIQFFTNDLLYNPPVNGNGGKLSPLISVSADFEVAHSKASIAKKVCRQLNIPLSAALAVGDSLISDSEIFEVCGKHLFVEEEDHLLKVLDFI